MGLELPGWLSHRQEMQKSAAQMEKERPLALSECSAAKDIHKERGEDAAPISRTIELPDGTVAHYLIIADGMGGSGVRRHETSSGEKTEAAIAAETASQTIDAAFLGKKELLQVPTEELRQILISLLSGALEKLSETYSTGNVDAVKLRGSLVRDFPTTVSVAVTLEETGRQITKAFWIGDSPIYVAADDVLSATVGPTGELSDSDAIYLKNGAVSVRLNSKEIVSAKGFPVVVLAGSDSIIKSSPDDGNILEPIRSALAAGGDASTFLKTFVNDLSNFSDDATAAVYKTTRSGRQVMRFPKSIKYL